MFGGLTKTSSRIAIAAAFGLMLGGFAFKATPAKAADLGGDCCADLEERVAELEATTVRKGNKKVSVTLSGWVVKTINWWDDGDNRQLRRRRQGLRPWLAASPSPASATIAPGWSAGYNMTVTCAGSVGPVRQPARTRSARVQSVRRVRRHVRRHQHALLVYLHQERHVRHPELGSSEPGVGQPGGSRRHFRHGDRVERGVLRGRRASSCGLRARRQQLSAALPALTWHRLPACQGSAAGIGADCFGAARAGGSLRFADLGRLPVRDLLRYEHSDDHPAGTVRVDARTSNFWDVAVFYTADWNSIKLSAASAYTWQENGRLTNDFQLCYWCLHRQRG